MDPHESPWLRVFQKRPKEMDLGLEWLARVEIQNVWVDQNPPCGVHSYWRSRKHVLEVTSCFRSLPQKIWRYATSGPPRFPKGVEWVEVTYQNKLDIQLKFWFQGIQPRLRDMAPRWPYFGADHPLETAAHRAPRATATRWKNDIFKARISLFWNVCFLECKNMNWKSLFIPGQL